MFDNMRICRLNRIQIKDPKSWDKAKLQEKIEVRHAKTLNERKESQSLFKGIGSFKTKAVDLGQKSALDEAQNMLTINEEITIYEFAPKIF